MVEETLHQVNLLPEGKEKEILLSELENHPVEVIGTLFDLLPQKESAPILVVLRVVQRIGYPRNETALPALLWLVAYARDTLDEKALQLLVEIGLQILPILVQMAHNDPDMDDLLTSALYGTGRIFYSDMELPGVHEPKQKKLIQVLSTHPEEVSPLLEYVLMAVKDLREIAILVVGAIGYPRNATLIPLIIEQVCDPNNLAIESAIQVLHDLGPDVLVPYFIEALWKSEKKNSSSNISVRQICVALLIKDLSAILPGCGPTLAYLLGQPSHNHDEDTVHFLLRGLEAIGPECAIYALPALITFLQHKGTGSLRKRALNLIASFDPVVVAPYSRLLADFSNENS